jgi:hypothetical protein
MTHHPPSPKLYLLVPWELPIQQQLSDENKFKLCHALKHFLNVLEQASCPEAATAIDQALEKLDINSISPIQLASTQTPLAPWEVEDFDIYFDVSHVQAQEPAVCMVRSLLVSYQAFLILSYQGSDFDLTQAEQQRQGFRSYVYLIARVFDLSLE